MQSVPMSRARQQLPEIVNRAAYRGERTIISRSGKDLVAVVSMEDLERLRQLEDRKDLKHARAALAEAKRKGTVPWTKLKAETGP